MIKGIELKQHVHLGLHTKGLIGIASNQILTNTDGAKGEVGWKLT